jgi:hypothetical protein
MTGEVPEAVRRATPTLEAARAQGIALPEGPPTTTLALAALRVLVHGQHRRTWREEATLPSGVASRLRDREPPPADVPSAQHMVVERIGQRHDCTRCGGVGSVIAGGQRFTCPECKGSGAFADVHVRRLVDTMEKLTDVILPTQLRTAPGFLHVERVIESIVPEEPGSFFECHDLRKIAQTSAYRGATRQQDPDFHGSDFADAIEVATRTIDAFLDGKGKLLRWIVRAWGWPLLWVRWGEPWPDPTTTEVVLVADLAGNITVIRPQAAPRPSSPGLG